MDVTQGAFMTIDSETGSHSRQQVCAQTLSHEGGEFLQRGGYHALAGVAGGVRYIQLLSSCSFASLSPV